MLDTAGSHPAPEEGCLGSRMWVNLGLGVGRQPRFLPQAFAVGSSAVSSGSTQVPAAPPQWYSQSRASDRSPHIGSWGPSLLRDTISHGCLGTLVLPDSGSPNFQATAGHTGLCAHARYLPEPTTALSAFPNCSQNEPSSGFC